MQRRSDVAPLGLRQQWEKASVVTRMFKHYSSDDEWPHLSHGACKEDGPVQHPAAPRGVQAMDEDRQQRQSVEQIH